MTDTELKTLKDNLWHSADMLRSSAHLAANKYGQPILGLIFLRYAEFLRFTQQLKGSEKILRLPLTAISVPCRILSHVLFIIEANAT